MKSANKNMRLNFSEKTGEFLFDLVTYFFIALFLYTASSKIITLNSFIQVLGKSPLLGEINVIVGYLIPIIEVIISAFLLFDKTKITGLILSLILITIFTSYLIYMVNTPAVKLPCMCGGIISSMSWHQHIWFNVVTILIAIYGLLIYKVKP